MYTVARNESLTCLKNKNAIFDTVELLADIHFDQQSTPFKLLEWKDFYYFLSKLPAATRAICILFYIEGYSIKEIASQLSIKDGTIKWHLNESRTRLKVLFTKTSIS